MLNEKVLYDSIMNELEKNLKECEKIKEVKNNKQIKVIMIPCIVESNKDDDKIGSIQYSNVMQEYNRKISKMEEKK